MLLAAHPCAGEDADDLSYQQAAPYAFRRCAWQGNIVWLLRFSLSKSAFYVIQKRPRDFEWSLHAGFQPVFPKNRKMQIRIIDSLYQLKPTKKFIFKTFW